MRYLWFIPPGKASTTFYTLKFAQSGHVLQRSDEQVLQFKSTSSPFQEDGEEPLLSNSEGLQSSDRSAQDQGMNVMSSYQKENHKHYLSLCL